MGKEDSVSFLRFPFLFSFRFQTHKSETIIKVTKSEGDKFSNKKTFVLIRSFSLEFEDKLQVFKQSEAIEAIFNTKSLFGKMVGEKI